MKTKHVVAAIIHHDNRIFATQRGYGEFKDGWEFPGGKVEKGETPEQAIVREIEEELNAKIKIQQYFDTIEYDYPTFHLSMRCYICRVQEGELVLREHEAAKWLGKDELYSVDWLPADLSIIEEISHNWERYFVDSFDLGTLVNLNETISFVVNGIKEGKGLDELAQVYLAQGKDKVINYAIGKTTRAINDTFAEANALGIQELAGTDFANRLIETSLDIANSVRQLAMNEINPDEFKDRLMKVNALNLGVEFVNAAGLDVEGIKNEFKGLCELSAEAVAYAAYCEVYDEMAEALDAAEMSYQRRIEIEKECARSVSLIKEYRMSIQKLISDFFEEHYEVINDSFAKMDEAILNNDSNRYLKANADLQNLLGREAQFTNQNEFDELMDSDLDFKL